MKTRTGTALALFLVALLMCSGALFAQPQLAAPTSPDHLVYPATTGTTFNPGTGTHDGNFICWAYSTITPTQCIAGQFFRGDGAVENDQWYPNPSILATSGTNYYAAAGAWTNSNNSTSGAQQNNGANTWDSTKSRSISCTNCHGHNPGDKVTNTEDTLSSGDYLLGGHKNILRKVIPGQELLDSNGQQLTTVADHNGWSYTLATDGTLTGGTGGTKGTVAANGTRAYYVAGWSPNGAEDVFFDTTGNTTAAYGSCARCHTTGYSVDANGPEPSVVSGTGLTATYTPLTDAQFSRIPAGAYGGAGTSSWFLDGIQCERCHKIDAIVSTTMATSGHLGHDSSVAGTAITGLSAQTIPGTDLTEPPSAYGIGVKMPNTLVCIECHQTYATWTSNKAGVNGEVHPVPQPGFEADAKAYLTPLNNTTTPFVSGKAVIPQGQFTAPAVYCYVNGTLATTSSTYAACAATTGVDLTKTVWAAPLGMSHGVVSTILNSPHARANGYVDYSNPQQSAANQPGLSDVSSTVSDALEFKSGPNKGTASLSNYDTVFLSEEKASTVCTGCHNIHGYMQGYVTTNAVNETSTLKTCDACHTGEAAGVNHPTGPGTPAPGGSFDGDSCSVCHMANKNSSGQEFHFLRINSDASYYTVPTPKQYSNDITAGNTSGYVKFNTFKETRGTSAAGYTAYPAVALDVDIACGQCHTGNDGVKNEYAYVPYAGDGGTKPTPYTRAFLAQSAMNMHNGSNGTLKTPVFNVPSGALAAGSTVTITSPDGAPIFYTTDGSTPKPYFDSATSTVIVDPNFPSTTKIANGGSITVSSSETIYAVAAVPGQYYGQSVSSVAVAKYNTAAALPAPSITPSVLNSTETTAYIAAGGQTLTLSDTNYSATIKYTIDGSDPTTGIVYNASAKPVVYGSATIKAVATDGTNFSAVTTATYTVKALSPTFSNLNGAKYAGTYSAAAYPLGVPVLLVNQDTKASVCYGVNVVPAADCTGGVKVAQGTLFNLPTAVGTYTVKAFSFKADGAGVLADSGTVQGVYTIKP